MAKKPKKLKLKRIALRPDSRGYLDDVVVQDVSMFRAEMMDDRNLWMCCYLPDTGGEHGDRIAFNVRAKGNRLEFTVTEKPMGRKVTYEEGSL